MSSAAEKLWCPGNRRRKRKPSERRGTEKSGARRAGADSGTEALSVPGGKRLRAGPVGGWGGVAGAVARLAGTHGKVVHAGQAPVGTVEFSESFSADSEQAVVILACRAGEGRGRLPTGVAAAFFRMVWPDRRTAETGDKAVRLPQRGPGRHIP